MRGMLIALAAALALATSTPWAKAPADATGECKDGTFTTAATKSGACAGHGGIKNWLAKGGEEKSGKAAAKAEKQAAPAKASKADTKSSPAAKPATAAAAAKPADATGECKDGTFTTAATKSGACAGHKGVKTWFGGAEKTEAKKQATAAREPASPKSSAAMPAPAPAPASPAPAKSASTPPAERTAAAGGGAGKVWVNTDSKVYHCEKDALYGKTRKGEYMTEAQAKASGARAARGKGCS